MSADQSICSCGRRIQWGVDGFGKKIPMDPTAPVYSVFENTNKVVRTTLAMVSHFATCRDANKFSASNGKEPSK